MNFRKRLCRAGDGCLWRLEVQKRGAVHWHCLIATERRSPVGELRGEWLGALASLGVMPRYVHRAGYGDSPVTPGCVRVIHGDRPCQSWYDIADEPRTTATETDAVVAKLTGANVADIVAQSANACLWGKRVVTAERVKTLDRWPGANLAAVKVEPMAGHGAGWLRYLQDHCTKAKQEQIARGFGKHWGVIGTDAFDDVQGESVELDDQAHARFLRAFRRLCSPLMRRDDPTGKHKARGHWPRKLQRQQRATRGASVWFSSPDTIRRIADWAKEVS